MYQSLLIQSCQGRSYCPQVGHSLGRHCKCYHKAVWQHRGGFSLRDQSFLKLRKIQGQPLRPHQMCLQFLFSFLYSSSFLNISFYFLISPPFFSYPSLPFLGFCSLLFFPFLPFSLWIQAVWGTRGILGEVLLEVGPSCIFKADRNLDKQWQSGENWDGVESNSQKDIGWSLRRKNKKKSIYLDGMCWKRHEVWSDLGSHKCEIRWTGEKTSQALYMRLDCITSPWDGF